MKLTKVAKDRFSLQLHRREKHLLLDILKLYPRIPSAHLKISKSGHLPDQDSSQKLLDEALAEQRDENKKQIQALLSETGRWKETPDHWQLSLSAAEIEWLLQILNDIRVGSWVILGAPEDRVELLNTQTAPHLWAMEMAGFFQMYLLHALEEPS